MASPQKENSNTGIANELMEVLAKIHIPPASMSCILVVLRETWGWHGQGNYKYVTMSNNDIAKKTGLVRQNVVRAMRWLFKANILRGIESKLIPPGVVRIKNDSTGVSTIGFNKDYDTWNVPDRINSDSIKNDSKGSIKNDSHKPVIPLDDKINKKEKVKKEKITPSKPKPKPKPKSKKYIPPNGVKLQKQHPWLDPEIWDDWVVFRQEIKKPLTETSVKQQIKFLSEFKCDHVDIITKSIRSGWQGLFEPKNNSTSVKLTKFEEKERDEICKRLGIS